MTAALWLLVYGSALAWWAPPVLRRMTSHGISPHMGVAAWLATVAATLAAWLVALILVIGATTDSIRTGAVVTLYRYQSPVHTTTTAADGSYVVGGAPPGTNIYTLGVEDPLGGRQHEYYNNAAALYAASLFSVASAGETRIDLALAAGAGITGTVTDAATRAAAAGVPVTAVDQYGLTLAATTRVPRPPSSPAASRRRPPARTSTWAFPWTRSPRRRSATSPAWPRWN